MKFSIIKRKIFIWFDKLTKKKSSLSKAKYCLTLGEVEGHQLGQSLIELLVAIGFAAVLLPALFAGFVAARGGRPQQDLRQEALAYAREGQDAIRVVRDVANTGWTNIQSYSSDTPSSVTVTPSSTWTIAPGTQSLTGGFTRSVLIYNVYRDISGAIAASGTSDPSTKKVVVNVSWDYNGYPYSVATTQYITRNTNVSQTWTGVLQPPASGGDWCSPTATTLTASLSATLTAINVTQPSTGGNITVFAGAGQSNNGNTYASFTINDPTSPTTPSILTTNNGNYTPKIKTYGAFNDNTFGYLATQQHSNQGQGTIVNLSNLQQIGSLDLGNSTDGQSIYVVNNFNGSGKNIAFLTGKNSKLYAFDITSLNSTSCTSSSMCHFNPINSSGYSLDGNGMKIIVATIASGVYAYVATNSSSNQFDILNVTNIMTSAPAKTSVSVGNSQPGVDVSVNAGKLRAYLVTNTSSTKPDFFTIDIDPTDTSANHNWYTKVINTFTTVSGMNPNGVVAVTNNKAIIVGTGTSWDYQVINDVSIENIPPPALSACPGTGLNVSYGIYGVATLVSQAGRTFSYLLSGDTGKEFKVIEGGNGIIGSGNGTYISPLLDTGHDVAFNYFSGSNRTNLTYKIDIEHASGGSCPSLSPSVAIPDGKMDLPGITYINPGQCMEFKITNTTSSPQAYSVTINYSP